MAVAVDDGKVVRSTVEEVPPPSPPSETTPLLADKRHIVSYDVEEQRPVLADKSEAEVPVKWQTEAGLMVSYMVPQLASVLLQRSFSIASITAVSQLGTVEIGALSLATLTANMIGNTLVMGLASCLDTLTTQAYGAGHKHLVGLQLQRAVCFILPCLAPLLALWWLGGAAFFGLISPDAELARLAGLALRVLTLRMPAFVVYECVRRFLQAQGIFYAPVRVLVLVAPLNAALMWLFVWRLGWGFAGAPLATVVSDNLLAALLVLYVFVVDGHECWGGFSRDAFRNWGPMIRLAVPGTVMMVAELAAFEVLTLASGWFGTAHLAAQSILVNLGQTACCLPFPLSIAAGNRLGNLIGAGDVRGAKVSIRVAFTLGVILSAVTMVLLVALRHQLPRLFSEDIEVMAMVASVLPIVAVLQFFDGMAALAHALLRGAGWQEFGGYVNVAVYYAVALPVCFGTAFGLGWQLHGLWVGIALGSFLVTALEFGWLFRSNIERAVIESNRRNG